MFSHDAKFTDNYARQKKTSPIVDFGCNALHFYIMYARGGGGGVMVKGICINVYNLLGLRGLNLI